MQKLFIIIIEIVCISSTCLLFLFHFTNLLGFFSLAMAGKDAKGYCFYPVAADSSSEDSDEDYFAPGALFRREQEKKRRRMLTATLLPDSSPQRMETSSASGASCSSSNASTNPTTTTTATTNQIQVPINLPTSDPWCGCGNCSDMPTSLEKKFCLQETLTMTNFQDENFIPGEHCVLNSSLLVNHVLDATNIEIAWMYDQQLKGVRGDGLLCKANMTARNYRHWAYRQYIRFIYSRLGRFVRKVIPACVVAHIRYTWPEPNGNYVGFKHSAAQEEEIIEEHGYIPPDELQAFLEGDEI